MRYDGENMTYEASTFMYAIAVSIFAIGGMCGGFIGGWIANKFGRKGGLLINNVVGIIAATAMVFSKYVTSYELLIVGRYLIGVNCGKETHQTNNNDFKRMLSIKRGDSKHILFERWGEGGSLIV